MAGISSDINYDFRPFISKLRASGEKLERRITSRDVRQSVLLDIAGEFIQAEGFDTGATQASIDAIASGQYVQDEAYSNGKVTRFANAAYTMSGNKLEFSIDPVDERGNHYGEFSVNLDALPTDFTIKTDGVTYETIYEIVREALT